MAKRAPEPIPDGPNGPDSEGRDLFDPAYGPANERTPIAVANGSYVGADGKLKWSWKKC